MKKKVLYLITKSNFGGAQRYVFELATHLPREEYEVVVAAGGDGPLIQKLKEAGIRTRTVKSFERDINLMKEVRAMLELWTIIKEERPDIVHVNSSKAGGSGAFIARLLRTPHIVFTAHGWPFFERRGTLWRLLAWFFSWLTTVLAHKTIVVSEHDLKRAYLPFTHRKLALIRTAVPEIHFHTTDDARRILFSEETIARHTNDTWLLSTSEHTQNKNLRAHLTAVRAYNDTHLKKIFLTLMGGGEDTEVLKSYVREHNLSDTVVFTGYVDDARTYLNGFDVFILPSRKEGTPYGLLEAGAAGLFSIASNVGGIPEVIIHGENGVLFDPESTDALTQTLSEHLENSELRARLGEALRATIARNFGLEQMVSKTRTLYES